MSKWFAGNSIITPSVTPRPVRRWRLVIADHDNVRARQNRSLQPSLNQSGSKVATVPSSLPKKARNV